MLGEPFTLDGMHNLASDQRTRILLFASGIDDNSLSLFTAMAEGPNNQVYALTVEDVRRVPGFDWLSQITVVLPESVGSPGDFGISLTYRGRRGNRALASFAQ
jgi:hypothetical protein